MAVVVKLEAVDLQVEAGSEVSLSIEVTNTGSIVERFEIAVVGPMAPWASVEPPALNLDAGVAPEFDTSNLSDRAAAATGTARITFRIPRAPNPLAGTYDFAVHVRATADQSVAKVEEARITVLPFVALETEIVPETSRGSFSGGHQLAVANRGNIAAEVSVRAVQVNRELGFQVVPPLVGVAPGKDASIKIRARPKDTFLLGPSKQVPFQVKIDEPLAGSSTTPAYLDQRAIIPSWVKPLASLGVAAAALILLGPPIFGALFPKPSEAAVVSFQPSVGVTSQPSITPPTPFGPPTPTPPPPTPPQLGDPDSLVATGDGNGLNPELVNIEQTCKPDANCRRNVVIPRVTQGLTGLQGIAIGAQLDAFSVTKPGTLVVLAKWKPENPYPYLDDKGQELGRATEVAFDLAPLLVEGGKAYVRIRTAENAVVSYFVPTENADLLLKSLYLVTPGSVPTLDPAATFGRDLGGFYDRATLWGTPLRQVRFTP